MRKLTTWQYLVILLGLSIAWILSDPSNKWKWIVIGAIGGFVLEAISTLYREKRRKLSNAIELILLVGCIFLSFFSAMVPEMLGIAVGIFFAITLIQLFLQLYQGRVSALEEIRKKHK